MVEQKLAILLKCVEKLAALVGLDGDQSFVQILVTIRTLEVKIIAVLQDTLIQRQLRSLFAKEAALFVMISFGERPLKEVLLDHVFANQRCFFALTFAHRHL